MRPTMVMQALLPRWQGPHTDQCDTCSYLAAWLCSFSARCALPDCCCTCFRFGGTATAFPPLTSTPWPLQCSQVRCDGQSDAHDVVRHCMQLALWLCSQTIRCTLETNLELCIATAPVLAAAGIHTCMRRWWYTSVWKPEPWHTAHSLTCTPSALTVALASAGGIPAERG